MAAHNGRSYWVATSPRSELPALSADVAVDVAIIGGGLVGITTARLLRDRGLSVAVVEARRIGEEVTGKSTAKVTSQHGLKYRTVESKFGRDGARLYAEANQTGLRTIVELAARHGIDCELERKAAFTYTQDDRRFSDLEQEVGLAVELGLPASMTRSTGLPFEVRGAMRWDDQAQFHPVKYLKGLAASAAKDGVLIFENSRVTDWDHDRIATETAEVRARHVVMATHLPLGQTGLFYAENYPHMHAVIMGRTEAARVPDGMYINIDTPRRSIRGHRDENGQWWLLLTGPTFTHGDTDEQRRGFTEIEAFARDTFGVTADYRWTNEDYKPMDGAPFVGRSSRGSDAVLVATGFDAWGITNGTAASMLIADLIDGRENAWLELYDARRVKPIAGGGQFIKGNAKVASHLVGGHLGRKLRRFEELARGEAAILKIDGHNVAGYRDDQGKLHAVSAACTHMGCILGWNETDRTWDCPCHGSRFSHAGEVIHGPAVKALAPQTPGLAGSDDTVGVEEAART